MAPNLPTLYIDRDATIYNLWTLDLAMLHYVRDALLVTTDK